MRLIDADALSKDLVVVANHSLYKRDGYNHVHESAIMTALDFINDAPTVDPDNHGECEKAMRILEDSMDHVPPMEIDSSLVLADAYEDENEIRKGKSLMRAAVMFTVAAALLAFSIMIPSPIVLFKKLIASYATPDNIENVLTQITEAAKQIAK